MSVARVGGGGKEGLTARGESKLVLKFEDSWNRLDNRMRRVGESAVD